MVENESPAKLLVIDDEQSVALAISTLLKNEGYYVDTVFSGFEGINIFKQRVYDLVITDLRLGDITGIEVLKEVKSHRPKSAVIILTGYATTESAVEAVRLGADDYLTKPIRMNELSIAVRKQIDAIKLREEVEELNKTIKEERDKLRRSVAELTILKSLVERMVSALSYREGFELIFDFLVRELQADVAAIYEIERNELSISSKAIPNDYELGQLIDKINERGSKLPGWNITCSREALVKPLTSADINPDYKLCSIIVVPIFQENKLYGILAAASRTDEYFELNWEEFAKQLAQVSSEFLSRVKKSVERQQKLTSAIVEYTLEGLALINMTTKEVMLNPVARSLLEISLGVKPTIDDIEKKLDFNLKNYWDELHKLSEEDFSKRTIVKYSDIVWRGRQVFLRLSFSLLPEIGGKENLMLLSLNDVTQERAVEEMKIKLISNISHELRTPTAVVKEFISIIRDGIAGELNPKQKEIIEVMNNNIERLARLIDNLLTVSRIDTGEFNLVLKPEPLYPIVESVVESLKPKFTNKNMTINVKLPNEMPLIYADREGITQILINLLENARKYSPENTEVTVSAEVKGNRVVVAVSDQGYGIPPDEKENIFKRFHRLVDKDNPKFQEGVGLGLSLVKDIITKHGGDIWVISEVNKGSTFYFSLQIAQEE